MHAWLQSINVYPRMLVASVIDRIGPRARNPVMSLLLQRKMLDKVLRHHEGIAVIQIKV